MDISIIPGATCAVIRIKIVATVNNILTKWKILYRKKGVSTYTEEGPMSSFQTNEFPLFRAKTLLYDLDGLEPNTTYQIKLVVTEKGDSNIPSETSQKEFTTCSLGDFEFKDYAILSGTSTQESLEELVNEFKARMIAVGYDYKVTEERSPNPYNDGTYFSAKFYIDPDSATFGSGGYCDGYKGKIVLYSGYISNIPSLIHEYRHYLGLSSSYGQQFLFHGDDPCGAGFDRANHPQYCSTISRVAGFPVGIDTDEMEIYMFYGENSVDGTYIPRSNCYMGYMLLKALGLNDVNIVY